MKLRRLDILGFKSFRFKTGLEVADGVTVVVGPNGCGKSNIVDAIRWAIGSQSAKDLRGRAMEDVIFAGSQNHKPMGYAEVSLTLENTGGSEVPAEWRDAAELKITRRLFRTGESEYEINSASCRLRDIHELFLGTGVGAKEAYSIIEQGRIGFIVASRPEERRILIEEAAGITRYKFQRKTAERRLERTRENLLRVKDVLDEVSRQLSALERQAKRAAAWKALAERRRAIEICAALHRLDRAAEAATAHHAELERLRIEHTETANRVAIAETRYAQLGVDLKLRETALEEATEHHFRASARVELLQNNVGHHERERDNIAARRATLAEQVEEQQHALQRAEAERLELDAQRTATEERLAAASAALDTARAAVDKARADERAASTAAQRAMQALNDARGTLARAGGRLDSIESEQSQMTARLQAAKATAEEATNARQHVQRSHDEAVAAQTVAADATETAAVAHRAALDSERATLEALQAAQRAQRTAAADALQAQTVVESLRAALARGEGYGAGVRALLKAGAAGQVQGVARPLAERLRVDAAHEKRLTATLGAWLGAAVVEDEDDLAAVVAWARASNAALPILSLSAAVAESPVPWVTFVEPVPGWVATQLETTVVVDDVARPTTRHPSVDDHGTFAPAIDAVQVGVSASEVSAVKTARKLAEAEAEARRSATEADAAAARLRAVEEALETALVTRTSARAALDRAQATEADTKRVAAQTADDLARSERRREQSLRDLDGLTERSASLADQAQAFRTEAATAEAAIERLRTELTALEHTATQHRRAAELAQDALNDAGVHHASAAERARTLVETRRRVDDLVRQSTLRARQLVEEATTLEKRARELDVLLTEDRRGYGAALLLADQAAAALTEVRAKHDELAALRLTHEADVVQLRTEANRADQRVRELEVKAERSRTEQEHAEGALLERFALSIASARTESEGLAYDEAMREEIRELNARIERMGPVNPAAEEAFDEARERFGFLSGQRDDLEAAMADLEAAIRKMDRTSRERFGEMFHAINERFQKIYPRLFRGGNARLELTAPDDLLGTGVEIVVQPPGKKLQSMTLMSGGEKALTAVALIFAIFQLKPTPFCILDEVDAPLDDANVARFAAMVEEMSAESQFLIITHNKTTMEAARTLYGVTMQEPGVSNVVGVRLHGRELITAPG